MYKTKIIFQPLIALFLLLALSPQVHAAKYRVVPNPNLIKGCNATIEIEVDSEGANILAGDASLLFNGSEFQVHQVNVANALPMQVFEKITGNTIQVSGARFPQTGTFTGVDTYAYISVTPSLTANSGTISFSSDINNDSNLVTDNIQNVLNDAIGGTFNFKDPYNGSYCTPDLKAPTVQFINPPNGSGSNPVDTDIVFAVSDNRAGVNKDSIRVTVAGQTYDAVAPEVFISESGGVVRVKLNPATNFNNGQRVNVQVYACDLNSPQNCDTYNSVFTVVPQAPPAPVCGDGLIQQNNGEQCDDGNNVDGDGCSLLCLLERPLAASCNDGIHNQGEEGIDCGGPCINACPTCVDNIRNQGEQNVDCGGPCPSCSQKIDKSVTICHFPNPGDKKTSYSLVIPETQLAVHQLHGDISGPCATFQQCPQAVLLVAPEREKNAISEAVAVIEKGVISKSKSAIDLPNKITSQLDLCRTNPDFAKANLNLSSSDLDGDGLTDRVECYGGTHPGKIDTDGDTCTDFDELNDYHTNPLLKGDCEVALNADLFSEILITDPKPSWIVSTLQPTISGRSPEATQFLIAIATPAEQAYINEVSQAIAQLLSLNKTDSPEKMKGYLDALNLVLAKADQFLNDYREVADINALDKLISSIPRNVASNTIFNGNFIDTIEKIRFDLLKLKTPPVTALASTEFEETFASDLAAQHFEGISTKLHDKTLYDLVATAYLIDGSKVVSKAIRFGVDTSNTVNKPVPRTIAGESLDSLRTTVGSLMIGGKAFAQNENGDFEVEIKDQQPVITGETEFGSNVFAIWHSVVLASSVISDSEQGAFEIQAPRALEVDTPHRATLYAVKTSDNGKQVRSESIDVYFKIKKTNFAAVAAGTVFALSFLGMLGYAMRSQWFRKRFGIRFK